MTGPAPAGPRRYEAYARDQAIRCFGDERAARSVYDGQWLVFSDVVLAFLELGPGPDRSHFVNGKRLRWVVENPRRLHDDPHTWFIPVEIIGPKARTRRIHLFARPAGQTRHVYLGEMEPTYMIDGGGAAELELRETLPSSVWSQLGGPRFDGSEAAAVDQALSRLRDPTTLDDRLDVLRTVVEYWHGPIASVDGISGGELAGIEIPRALAWWYEWAGRRREIMSGQNRLYAPGELRDVDGRLLFYAENQFVYQWATVREGDDPPVFGRYESRDPWEPEGMRVSEHLILACLLEAVMCHSPYGASCVQPSREALAALESSLDPIAIDPWRWVGPTRFYARNGAFMYTMSGGEEVPNVFLGAKSDAPLRFIKPFIDRNWEYSAV